MISTMKFSGSNERRTAAGLQVSELVDGCYAGRMNVRTESGLALAVLPSAVVRWQISGGSLLVSAKLLVVLYLLVMRCLHLSHYE